jgi:signal transduction histidine kinase
MISHGWDTWDARVFQVFQSVRFRLAIGFAGVLTGMALVAFAVIYWQITSYELVRADEVLAGEASLLAARQSADSQEHIPFPSNGDLKVPIGVVGLFSHDHKYLSGSVTVWPAGLKADGIAHVLDQSALGKNTRGIARALSNGEQLIVMRKVRALKNLCAIVLHALGVCAATATTLSLLGGGWLSNRALKRIEILNRAIDCIMGGGLHERLPIAGTRDEIDRLAGSVNRMLDRIEGLVDEIKAVGDDIAHDLRAPLTRVRNYLDQGQSAGQGGDGTRLIVGRAISELDQCLAAISALLRLGEMETGQRRAAFRAIDLADVAANIFDAYEPVAEEKNILLRLHPNGNDIATTRGVGCVQGDRDLLIEVAGNLVENAIKYTPSDGCVVLEVGAENGCPFLRVRDNGPGIAAQEREAVLRRYFRSQKHRQTPGHGIGLSLVAAIARLHDAKIMVEDGSPGSVFTIIFPASVSYSLN